ncbi:MAG: polyprenyl synthetase family protein [Actinomycetota bacterium]
MEAVFKDEVGAALDPVTRDLQRMEEIMLEASAAATVFLTEATTYLTRAGGKRLRPALVALSAQLGSGTDWRVHATGAAIELTHLATLYHDDVIDEADVRRGVASANEKWGNTVAILVGDYLFARASGIAADVGGPVPRVLADAIARVVQGQVRELESAYDTARGGPHYFATIEDKTAALIEASTRLGGALAGCSDELVDALSRFGTSFGLAFQIADDLLDIAATQEELGKAPGTDMRDGVYTLPVLLAMEADPSLASSLGAPQVDVEGVRTAVLRTGAFDRALAEAARHADGALEILKTLPHREARDSLERLTRVVVDRVPVLE